MTGQDVQTAQALIIDLILMVWYLPLDGATRGGHYQLESK